MKNYVMAEQEPNIIEKSLSQFKEASTVIDKNSSLSQRAVSAGAQLIADLEANEGNMTPELDAKMNEYLSGCSKSITIMQDRRKPYTQVFDMIVSNFTALEHSVNSKNKDSIAYKIQQIRNGYAAKLAKEAADREAAIKKQQAIDAEKVKLKAENKTRIIAFVGEQIKAAVATLQDKFDGMALETYEAVSNGIKAYTPTYQRKYFEAYRHGIYSTLITDADVNALLQPETESMFSNSEQRFVNAVTEMKNYLVDRLESKRQQLIDIKQMADEAEAERQKEEYLKLQMEKADAAKKEQLQKDLEAARIAREQKEKEENELAAEKKRIQDEERARAQAETDAVSIAATELVHAESNAEQTTLFFEGEHALTVANSEIVAPQVRSGYEIEVLTPVAYMSMFTQWFNLKGGTMTIAELDKKLDFIRKFCEKEAFKDESKKLQNSTLRYKETFTAVNNAKKK
jgi:hypothetical protein